MVPQSLGSRDVQRLLLSLSDWSVGILSVQGSFMPSWSWAPLGLDLFLPGDHWTWSVAYTVTPTRPLFMSRNVPRGTSIVTVTCLGWRGPDRVRSDARNLSANSTLYFAEVQGLLLALFRESEVLLSGSLCDQELKNSELGFGRVSPEISISILQAEILAHIYTLLRSLCFKSWSCDVF